MSLESKCARKEASEKDFERSGYAKYSQKEWLSNIKAAADR
jgi:hypothetical protein